MSSDHPSGDLSPAASPSADEPGGSTSEVSLVAFLRTRGAPLLDGLEAHLPGSRDQADGAAAYAFAAAAEIGLIRSSAEVIREAARLHGVGGIYVPADVLAKPAESRTPDEEALVAGQQEMGAQLARGAGIPDRVCEWIRLGAERYDGEGPSGLAGEAIPLQARISRAAHACRAALAQGLGAGALREAAGHELDPMVVDALEAVLSRARPG